MTQKDHALITKAVGLLEQVNGTGKERNDIQGCIRQLNAIANLSVINNSIRK